jgi:hypothetical protein
VIVPIWAARWEIECCQPDATIGERWQGPLRFDPDPRPWLAREGRTASADAEQFGLVELEVKRIAAPDSTYPLFVFGQATFSGPADMPAGHHVGRLWLDAHSNPPHELRITSGIVRRVDLVPLVYEKVGGRIFEPREQLASRTVSSTRDRAGGVAPVPDAISHVAEPEAVIWLELD